MSEYIKTDLFGGAMVVDLPSGWIDARYVTISIDVYSLLVVYQEDVEESDFA